jgi:hypothetical protein
MGHPELCVGEETDPHDNLAPSGSVIMGTLTLGPPAIP